MYQYSPIVQSLFPSFVLGDVNFNNTLQTRMFSHLSGPFSPSAEWELMFQRWEPIKYLTGGTPAMRAAKEKYLPRFRGEVNELYNARLLITTLFEAYSRTVDTLSALPFLTPIQIPNLPKELEYLFKHANGSEDTMNVFGRQLMEDLFHYGKAHILVDYPKNTTGKRLSIAEEKALNMRPYMIRLDPMNVIGWKYEYVGSTRLLTELRVAETAWVDDPDDEWNVISEQRVRVIRKNEIVIYRQYRDKTKRGFSKKIQYKEVDRYENSLGKVNVVTVYGKKTGFMTSKPMLEGLAYLNLHHYNKQSQLDNISQVASVPFLMAKGMDASQVEGLEITTHGMFCMTNPDGTVEYVEHSGNAIGALQEEIRTIKSDMVSMGFDALAARSTATRETAASKIMDNTKSNSILQAAVSNLEEGLAEALGMAAEWLDVTMPEDLKVNVGDKMELSVDANELTSLIQLMTEESMTPEDLTVELQRRGTISQSTVLKKPKKEEPVAPKVAADTAQGQLLDKPVENE